MTEYTQMRNSSDSFYFRLAVVTSLYVFSVIIGYRLTAIESILLVYYTALFGIREYMNKTNTLSSDKESSFQTLICCGVILYILTGLF